MKEIRVCWLSEVAHEPRGVFRDGGFWFGDFDEPRRALTLIVETENARQGAGTHWIEERDVREDGARCHVDPATVVASIEAPQRIMPAATAYDEAGLLVVARG